MYGGGGLEMFLDSVTYLPDSPMYELGQFM